MRTQRLAVGATGFVTSVMLALGLAFSPDASGQSQSTTPFSGSYSAPDCGAHTFPVGGAIRSITVVATTIVAANDIVLRLYTNGVELANSDTATSPEAITYSTGGELPSGDYVVKVCPYNGEAVVSPSDYEGTFTTSDVANPVTTPPPVPGERTASFLGGLSFGPATLVSAHFLGAEPQVEAERHEAWTPAGAPIDGNRVFVDWPLSTRSEIGQLSRSLDGGDSFRLLFDLTCAARSRPNCATGGGGDTESDINLVTGRLFFSDQEALANEAYASSRDHGDTWDVQTPIANATTATDRQWIAATDSSVLTTGGVRIGAFLEYHVPPQAYVQAITDNGLVLPQPGPQITNVGQSGQIRVDNNPSSPAHGWLYVPFNGYVAGAGVWVASVRSADYANPLAYNVQRVSASGATSFPWLSIDRRGNAYVTWDAGGAVYYSYASIDDPRNNPAQGGVPGSAWSGPARISLPKVTSAVFPENIAGADGRLGVTYMGTTDPVQDGSPDLAPTTTEWHVYAAVVTAAASNHPVVASGVVSHRVVHRGNICSGGTFCGLPGVGEPERDDRSLADMIDVTFDEKGRLGVVFMDNNSHGFQDHPRDAGDGTVADVGPFVYYARQTSGTSISVTSSLQLTSARDMVADATGDATWPNRAYSAPGANLTALDLRGLSLGLGNGDIVARLALTPGTTAATMISALAGYNAACPLGCGGARVQYVVRFASESEVYHLSFEALAGGNTRVFGGRLDDNDGLVNPASPTAVLAAAYHTDTTISAQVTGSLSGDALVLRVPAAALNLAAGSQLTSVTGLALAGPLEADEVTAATPMRTVDATPPFDVPLREIADLAIAGAGPSSSQLVQPVTYTFQITNAGPASAAGVTVIVTLPATAGAPTFTSSQGSCGAADGKGNVTCSLGGVPTGSAAALSVTLRPSRKGTVKTSASVFATAPAADPVVSNNTASISTTVR
jgi:uncharacterized repeat protein (TIGR01451 family)